MSKSTIPALFVLAILLTSATQVTAQQKDLTYNTIAPCWIANTFVAGGAFAANETRTYNVVGNGSLAGQGGSATGCGIPGFSNGVARVQAVALNVVVVNPTGAGHVWAIAADGVLNPFVPAFLAFPGLSPFSIANTGPVAVAQTSGIGDIKINVAVSGAHVVISVVGYYTRFGETILVGPEATPAASGVALINALASIADNSASKPYLIKVEPGVYDVGSTMLTMKPWVDIEGSGQQTTIIQGLGNNDPSSSTGVIKAASNAELRNLQVKSSGNSFSNSIGIVSVDADPRVRDVTIVGNASNPTANRGMRIIGNGGGRGLVDDVTVEVQGGFEASGIVTRGTVRLVIEDTRIRVSNAANAHGIFLVNGGIPDEIVRVEAEVAGTSTSSGIRIAQLQPLSPLKVYDSILTANGTGTNYGIRNEVLLTGNLVRSTIQATGGTANYGVIDQGGLLTGSIDHCEVTGATTTVGVFDMTIGASRLSGGPAYGTTCAGVYDETYTFFTSTCP